MSLLRLAAFVFKTQTIVKAAGIVKDALPDNVKEDIAARAEQVTTSVQEGAAQLLATHAPGFSKRIAAKAEPQRETLEDIQSQLAQLSRAVQQAQQPSKPASKKSPRRKTPGTA